MKREVREKSEAEAKKSRRDCEEDLQVNGSTRPGERAADAASDPPISAALPAIAALLVSPSAGSLEARATPTVDRLNFLSRGKDAPSPLADLTAEVARVAVAVARTVLAVFEIIPRVVSLVARLLGGPRRPATFSRQVS